MSTEQQESPEYFTVVEMAAMFRVGPRTIRNWILSGHLISVRPTGGKHLIPANQPALANYLNREPISDETAAENSNRQREDEGEAGTA